MLEDVAHRLHDLGDARLVIRSEERRPISRDERMLEDLQQLGELLYREHGIITEGDGRTIIVLDDLRADTTACEVRARIDMRDEPQHRTILIAWSSWDLRHHIALLFEADGGYPEGYQFVTQETEQVKLLLCRGVSRAIGIALRIDLYVAEEAIEEGLTHGGGYSWVHLLEDLSV